MATTLAPATAQEFKMVAELENIAIDFALRVLDNSYSYFARRVLDDGNDVSTREWYDYLDKSWDFYFGIDLDISLSRYDGSNDLRSVEIDCSDNYEFNFCEDGEEQPMNVREEFVEEWLKALCNKCEEYLPKYAPKKVA